MHRWDIINHFIRKHDYNSYLEIGYFKGWSFDSVDCIHKTAVDPNPSKDQRQERMPADSIIHTYFREPEKHTRSEVIFKCTSDQYFERINDILKYDIIFIDGLHEAEQVLRDVHNAAMHLSSNGVIILHDCNPPTLAHATTGDAAGNWNGDVYKAAFVLNKMKSPTSEFCVIDTDWGVGVFRPGNHFYSHSLPEGWSDREWWERFDMERNEWLNLISVEEFLKRETTHETA